MSDSVKKAEPKKPFATEAIAKKYTLKKGCGPKFILPGVPGVHDTRELKTVAEADELFKLCQEAKCDILQKVQG